MELELYDIIPALQPYVKVICSIDNNDASTAPCIFRVFPDTCVEIFFGYNNSTIAKINGKAAFNSSRSFVTSRMSRYMDVELPLGSGSIAVCFYPGAAFAFFPVPMKELTDENIFLSDLWGTEINDLEGILANCQNHLERASVIQRFLLSFIRKEINGISAFDRCLQQINRVKGQLPLKVLSKEFNISQRQLSRQFNTFMGLSPKEYSRVKRFICTMESIQTFPNCTLTQIAYENRYFDQAHFIHDCKEFTGMTPKQLVGSQAVL